MVVKETKRPDLSGQPHCKGVAIGVASRGARRSGERTLRIPLYAVFQSATPAVRTSHRSFVGRPCAGEQACVHASGATPLALRPPHLTWQSHASTSCELTVTRLPQRVQVSLLEIGFGASLANFAFCAASCACHVCTFSSYPGSSSARFRFNSFCFASRSAPRCACTRARSRTLLSKLS